MLCRESGVAWKGRNCQQRRAWKLTVRLRRPRTRRGCAADCEKPRGRSKESSWETESVCVLGRREEDEREFLVVARVQIRRACVCVGGSAWCQRGVAWVRPAHSQFLDKH